MPAKLQRHLLLVLFIFNAFSPALASETLWRGFNVIQSRDAPFTAEASERAFARTKMLGASMAAIVPFLWQPATDSSEIARGSDMSDTELVGAIHAAHAAGLQVVVKPHVWVPGSWAGGVSMTSKAEWDAWFSQYEALIVSLAGIAAVEKAEAFSIGTELVQATQASSGLDPSRWRTLISHVRAVFPGHVTYIAHGAEEAERIGFWDALDGAGVTLYPALGSENDPEAWKAAMQRDAERLDALARRVNKRVLVGEIGIRSAVGATTEPWESAEERRRAPDDVLQARVIAAWLVVLDRPSVEGVLLWRWLTDPKSGGAEDTDFTLQGKLGEGVVLCAWRTVCR